MKVKVFKLGATGRRPYGRLANNETDEGELQFALAADHANGIVRVEFGKAVQWLGLPVAQARALAAALTQAADDVEQRKG
jgi:hypothetical protein